MAIGVSRGFSTKRRLLNKMTIAIVWSVSAPATSRTPIQCVCILRIQSQDTKAIRPMFPGDQRDRTATPVLQRAKGVAETCFRNAIALGTCLPAEASSFSCFDPRIALRSGEWPGREARILSLLREERERKPDDKSPLAPILFSATDCGNSIAEIR
jgi:hypothetical protein